MVKILSTLRRADGGSAAVNGYDVGTQPAQVRGSISLTGQFAAVDEVLTGRENLELVGQLRHLPNPSGLADDLLSRFDLTDAARRPVKTYSGGMRRRLDIAMSLVGDSPVLSVIRRGTPQAGACDEPATSWLTLMCHHDP